MYPRTLVEFWYFNPLFYSFPKRDNNGYKRWLELCGFREGADVSKIVICSEHFKDEDYIDITARLAGGCLRLKPGAYPTQKIYIRSNFRALQTQTTTLHLIKFHI